MIGNKIPDKITSVGKSKEKTNKTEEIYVPPKKKDNKLLAILNCFELILHNNHSNHNNHNNHSNHNNYNNHNNHNNDNKKA